METILNSKQQKIYDFFIEGFGSRTYGHEHEIKEIVLTAHELINKMNENGDLEQVFESDDDLKKFSNNIGILYKIFDKIRPATTEELLNDTEIVYFILIMYAHWCESLRHIFRKFISQNSE